MGRWNELLGLDGSLTLDVLFVECVDAAGQSAATLTSTILAFFVSATSSPAIGGSSNGLGSTLASST